MLLPFHPSHVPDITDIYNHYILHSTATFDTTPVSTEEMRRRLLPIAQSFPFAVCQEHDRVIAYCYAHLWKEKPAYCRTLEITIYIAPQFTRQGIGEQLIARVIDECRTQGYHTLIACITDENTNSRSFFQKLGFREVSRFEQVGRKFDRWLGVTDYQLLLSGRP